jgi:hypothetical protein
MSKRLSATTFLAKALIISAGLLTGLAACSGGGSGKSEPSAPKTQSAASRSANTVVLTEEVQKAGGIVTKALEPTVYREHIEAYGTVLHPDGLLRTRNDYVSAKSSLEKAEAALRASKEEYRRLKSLNENDKNISDRMLQAGAAAMEADRAAESEAHENLRSVRSAAELQWGRILSGWIVDFSPGIERLLGLKDVLVQVTIPPGATLGSIPDKIAIQAPEGRPIGARLIIHAPATDPRIQGMSFIYIAPSHTTRLIPGMNVSAYLPAGGHEEGFIVPSSAVVWLQGRAWVYVKTTGTRFVRVGIPTSRAVRGGYFVMRGFTPGAGIVIRGAQALLSEERLPKTQGGEGEEGDQD